MRIIGAPTTNKVQATDRPADPALPISHANNFSRVVAVLLLASACCRAAAVAAIVAAGPSIEQKLILLSSRPNPRSRPLCPPINTSRAHSSTPIAYSFTPILPFVSSPFRCLRGSRPHAPDPDPDLDLALNLSPSSAGNSPDHPPHRTNVWRLRRSRAPSGHPHCRARRVLFGVGPHHQLGCREQDHCLHHCRCLAGHHERRCGLLHDQ